MVVRLTPKSPAGAAPKSEALNSLLTELQQQREMTAATFARVSVGVFRGGRRAVGQWVPGLLELSPIVHTYLLAYTSASLSLHVCIPAFLPTCFPTPSPAPFPQVGGLLYGTSLPRDKVKNATKHLSQVRE